MRVYRIYIEEGLAVRRLKRKRLTRPEAKTPLHVRSNQEWALDFVADTLGTGRGIPRAGGGRCVHQCLNASWFRTLADAREKISSWREEYHGERPRSSPEYRTPREFARQLV